MLMNHNILALDVAGNPNDWLSFEEAVLKYSKDQIAWSVGEIKLLVRGGYRKDGQRTVVEMPSIIALRDARFIDRVPVVTKDALLRRDRMTCAYCGQQFRKSELEAEHVMPDSRGGPYSWMNLVTACRACNAKKGNKTPDEAGMQLLYVPYIPNVWEDFILKGRNVLADQMEYLLAGVPSHSRLL